MQAFFVRIVSLATLAVAFVALQASCDAPANSDQYELVGNEEGLEVHRHGELVAQYLFSGGAKPVLWPLAGPAGLEMTRGYPLRTATDDEASDHPHHRSVWLGHGNVNGTDFWLESGEHGIVRHREFETVEGGEQATIVALSDWVSPTGEILLTEHRTMTIGEESEDLRWIDFAFTLTAGETAVMFGDTKEGTFGLRVPGWLKVEAGGTIRNSEGQQNEAAWGQPANWVDYGGMHEGNAAGVLVMNNPQSFGYPTRWHVRTYGLFAANPFGQHGFDSNAAQGGYELPAGESLELQYRVVLYAGAMTETRAAELWQAYTGGE